MAQLITVKFMDGRAIEAILAGAFKPDTDKIEILSEKDKKRGTYALTDLCCILIKGKPEIPKSLRHEEIEEVETVDASRYQVFIPKGNGNAKGFFGVPVKKNSPYKMIFFTTAGVRARRKDRSLGEILKESGFVSDEGIEEALEQQKRLRSIRIGEIIAENNRLAQETVDKAIQNVMQKTTPGSKKVRVGELLVSAGLITKDQVKKALESQESGRKKRIGTLLIENGFITEQQLLMALSAKFRMNFVDLKDIIPTQSALNLLSIPMIDRLNIMPLEADDKKIVVATSDPTDHTISEILRFNTNRKVELVAATSEQIENAIEKYFHRVEESMDELLDGLEEEDIDIEEDIEDAQVNEQDSQVIKFVNGILINAFQNRASDIHLEPKPGKGPLQVRYRIDGACHIQHQIPSQFKRAVISRIKIMSNLDIAERRKPQSGKIVLRMDRKKIEYRVETTPTVGDQEDAVLRILSSSRPLTVDEMGFSQSNLEKFQGMISKPYGIILCVGPTGSGKTTSLHSALSNLNKPDRKIWTAEDPVEITQDGLRQVQVNPKIGFSFKEALRSFLRADPDIIMIGEMRDAETAQIAIEASLTGHLVFSTLHTNSAPETVVRLIEMGMDPYNFADALLGVLAQRLARKLCENCKEAYHPEKEEFEKLLMSYGEENYIKDNLKKYSNNFFLMKRIGCKQCDNGYKGRMAIHELLVGSEPIKVAIKQGNSMEEIRDIAIQDGMRTLRMDGIHKVIEGHTDMDQVYRVCI